MSIPPPPTVFTANENLARICLVHIRLQDPENSYDLRSTPMFGWGIVQTKRDLYGRARGRQRWVIVDYREFTMVGTRATWWHTSDVVSVMS